MIFLACADRTRALLTALVDKAADVLCRTRRRRSPLTSAGVRNENWSAFGTIVHLRPLPATIDDYETW